MPKDLDRMDEESAQIVDDEIAPKDFHKYIIEEIPPKDFYKYIMQENLFKSVKLRIMPDAQCKHLCFEVIPNRQVVTFDEAEALLKLLLPEAEDLHEEKRAVWCRILNVDDFLNDKYISEICQTIKNTIKNKVSTNDINDELKTKLEKEFCELLNKAMQQFLTDGHKLYEERLEAQKEVENRRSRFTITDTNSISNASLDYRENNAAQPTLNRVDSWEDLNNTYQYMTLS